jgi:hypothetical protein
MLESRFRKRHPAQRLDQIRFAAPVRPDNAGEPGLDQKLSRLDKSLKARDAEFCQFHGAALVPHTRFWIICYYSTKLPSFWLTNPAWPACRTTCRMIHQRRLPPERVGERKVLR